MMMSTILQALESSEKDDVSGNWKWGASAHITKVDTAKISTFAHDGDPSYMYATDLLRSAEDNDGIVRMDRSVRTSLPGAPFLSVSTRAENLVIFRNNSESISEPEKPYVALDTGGKRREVSGGQRLLVGLPPAQHQHRDCPVQE